jgi:hypothetical protein
MLRLCLFTRILLHIGPLLGNDGEISDYERCQVLKTYKLLVHLDEYTLLIYIVNVCPLLGNDGEISDYELHLELS